MAVKRGLARLDALIWGLVYGGLGLLAVGLALRDVAGGHAVFVVGFGVAAALVGAVLIGVRARVVRSAGVAAPSASPRAESVEAVPDPDLNAHTHANPRKPS